MNTLSRRNFILSGFWLFAGLVLGRAASVPEGNASHPPEYDRAPLPDLAGEITTDECLTPIIEYVSMAPGQVYFLNQNQQIVGYPNFVETWMPETRR